MGTISEEMYCSEQINVPLNLPYILKQYAKAAIKTQPRDLLHWSSAYFRALANGDVPPVKDRIEYPLISTPSGLTAGFLRILIKQFGKGGIIEEKDLINKWKGVGLELDELQNMLRLCGFRKTVRWLNFVAVAAGFLSPNLTQTMILICELLTDEPEGGSAAIVYQTFMTLYIYLARMDCGPICHLKSNMADTFSEEVSAEAEEGTSEKSSERLSEIEVALEREPTLDSNDSANGVIMVWEDVTHPDFVQERNSIKDPKTAEENVEDNAADIAEIIPVDVVDEATTVVDEEEKADEEETVKSVESYDNTGITLTFHDEEQDVKIDDYTGPIEPKLKKRFEKKLEEEKEGGANEKTDDEDKTIKNDEINDNDATKENDNKEGEEVEEKRNEDEQGVGGDEEKKENRSDSNAGDEVEHKEEGEENENGEKVEGEDEIVGKEGDEEGKGDVGEGEEGAEKGIEEKVEGAENKGAEEKETEEEEEKEIVEEEVKKETEKEEEREIEEEVKKETEEEVEKEIEEELKKETEEELKKEIEEEVKKETDKKEEKGEGEKTPTPRTKKRKKKQAKKEGEEGEEEESDHEEQSRYEYSLELEEEEEDEKREEEKSVKEETVVITEEVEEVKEEEEEMKEEEEVAEEQVKEEQSIDLKITDSAVALQGQRKSDIQVYGCLHLPKHRRRSVTDSIVSEPDNHFWVHIPGIGPMVPEKQILSLKAYFLYCSEKQGGYVMPRNIKHHLCPSLEPPVEMEKRRSSEVEWINDAVHHDK